MARGPKLILAMQSRLLVLLADMRAGFANAEIDAKALETELAYVLRHAGKGSQALSQKEEMRIRLRFGLTHQPAPEPLPQPVSRVATPPARSPQPPAAREADPVRVTRRDNRERWRWTRFCVHCDQELTAADRRFVCMNPVCARVIVEQPTCLDQST
jgi:hypothetical protein